MRIKNISGLIFLFGALSACASLEDALIYRVDRLGEFQQNGQALGIGVKKEHYYEARQRWPWARGESLHRRAMILVLKPNPSDLLGLNQSSTEEKELKTLSKLIARRR
jgi:hypothetical protein